MTGRRVVITGRGVVSPLGVGAASHWAGVRAGRSVVARIPRLAGFPASRGCEIAAASLASLLDRVPRKQQKLASRVTMLALLAASLAMEEAGLDAGAGGAERFGVIVGVNALDWKLDPLLDYLAAAEDPDAGAFDAGRANAYAMRHLSPLDFSLKVLPNLTAGHLAIAWNARGPCRALIEGPVGGVHAVEQAWRMVSEGELDVALCGGAEAPLDDCAHGKATALGLVAMDDEEAGPVPGEAGSVLVLEPAERARARGADAIAGIASAAVVAGTGELASRDDPRRLGARLARTIGLAIDVAGAPPSLVVRHGDGLAVHERAEAHALELVFGLALPPTLALKRLHGDLGAASAPAEIAACCGVMRDGIVPAAGPEAEETAFPRDGRVLVLSLGTFGECAALMLAPVDAH
jgi:3-oxoacyl-[acyl-carrier-protein] synthase II